MIKRSWKNLKCEICQTNKYLELKWREVVARENLEKYSYVKCKKCGLVFMSPRYPPSQAPLFYSQKNYWDSEIKNFKTESNLNIKRKKAYGHLYKEIFKRKTSGSILDVGTGTGLFLSLFKEKGWNVLGTEISKEILDFSKRHFKIETLYGDILKIKLPKNYFDVICFNNVLEHVHYPKKTLLKTKDLLKNDGLLVITVPNIESLGAEIFKEKWYHLDPGRHLFLFSGKTVAKLLKESGFLVKKTSHSYWIHNYSGLFESLRSQFSTRFLKEISEVSFAKEPKRQFEPIKKILSKVFSSIGCIIEAGIKRGEVITVYAKKA